MSLLELSLRKHNISYQIVADALNCMSKRVELFVTYILLICSKKDVFISPPNFYQMSPKRLSRLQETVKKNCDLMSYEAERIFSSTSSSHDSPKYSLYLSFLTFAFKIRFMLSVA